MPYSPSMCSSGAWCLQLQPLPLPQKMPVLPCSAKIPRILLEKGTRWKSLWRRTWFLLTLQVSWGYNLGGGGVAGGWGSNKGRVGGQGGLREGREGGGVKGRRLHTLREIEE